MVITATGTTTQNTSADTMLITDLSFLSANGLGKTVLSQFT